MSSLATGKHAGPAPASGQPAIPEPTYAERARTLTHLGRVASLSTLSRKQPGFPFGSVMPYALDARANPIFLISTMAMHTQNIQADPRASLLVTDPASTAIRSALPESRFWEMFVLIPTPEVAAARELYLARYANSKYWVDFEDFAFYRMEVVDVYYVGGFGVMGWVSAAEYYSAEPDPLAESAAAIIQHMNADHADALVLLARVFAATESQAAEMTSVDRLGFHVRMQTNEGTRGARIAFSREARTPAEARTVLVDMVAKARQS